MREHTPGKRKRRHEAGSAARARMPRRYIRARGGIHHQAEGMDSSRLARYARYAHGACYERLSQSQPEIE